jgi:hypothetical protein
LPCSWTSDFEHLVLITGQAIATLIVTASSRGTARPICSTAGKLTAAEGLWLAEGRHSHTYDDIAQTIGVSRSTIIRHSG